MGILRSIESRLERVVEGSVGRLFRASVAPVELARKLAKELEEGKVVSVTQTYAPNEYTIYLSPRDRTRFADFEASLRNELASYLAEHARRAGYVMPTRPRVRFETESSLHTGIFGISTALVRDDDAPLELVPLAGAPQADVPRVAEPVTPEPPAPPAEQQPEEPEPVVRSPLDPDPDEPGPPGGFPPLPLDPEPAAAPPPPFVPRPPDVPAPLPVAARRRCRRSRRSRIHPRRRLRRRAAGAGGRRCPPPAAPPSLPDVARAGAAVLRAPALRLRPRTRR